MYRSTTFHVTKEVSGNYVSAPENFNKVHANKTEYISTLLHRPIQKEIKEKWFDTINRGKKAFNRIGTPAVCVYHFLFNIL